jgi:hypothetical protein
MKELIQGPHDVCGMLGSASKEGAAARLANFTDSRVWIEFLEGGVRLGASVIGTDFKTATYQLDYPFMESAFTARIKAIEEEAADLWDWSYNLEDEAPVVNYGFTRL